MHETVPTRDLSRAHWQRTVGQVIMTQTADAFHEHAGADTSEFWAINYNLKRTLKNAKRYNTEGNMPEPWNLAYGVSETAYATTGALPGYDWGVIPCKDPAMSEQFQHFTHGKLPYTVIAEGFETQSIFPLNLARAVSTSAGWQGITGFETNTLEDITGLLRRPDFQSIVMESAFTNNGFWSRFSNRIYEKRITIDGKELDFSFYHDQENKMHVSFPAEIKFSLRYALAEVNRIGRSNGIVERLPSSGCPAAHLRPHFTQSEEDVEQLSALSASYGKDIQTLTATRDRSVIQDSLDYLATALELFDKQLADCSAATAESSF